MFSYEKNSFLYAFCFLFSIFACAKESPTTPPVVGHMPIVKNINIIGDLIVGKQLTIQYDYYDQDGDPEGDTQVSWSNNKKGKSIFLEFKDAGLKLQSQITPYSKPIADPVGGLNFLSNETMVIPLPSFVPGFELPRANGSIETSSSSYSFSRSMCHAMGMRLPTLAEMESLYNTLKTVGKRFGYDRVDYFIGDKFGWPTNGIKGGDDDFYWVSDSDGVLQWAVNMNTGVRESFDTGFRQKQAICTR